MSLVLILMAAGLGFVVTAAAGMALAGANPSRVKGVKRVQALTSGTPEARQVRARARAAAAGADARRRQIVRSLQETEKQQKRVRLTLANRLLQAGLTVSVRQFNIASAVLGLVVMVLALFLRQNIVVCIVAGVALGLGLPRWTIGFLASRRVKIFTNQFADAMDIVVRGIRSGLPVHECLKVISVESPQPLGGEFKRLTESIAVGMPLDQGLEKMQERVPTPELRFFTIVMAVQQRTGGNLSEALANLSAVIRARKMMREKVKALSSEAVASAAVIGCLPPGVIAMISISSPKYMLPMFHDPRGHLMLLGAGVWMSVGIFIMRRMINFKM
ncbi:MAG TPA: type II secretion system F family protein [Caulobacteraceae bacterium]|nr:type II secretion system F family protein [Caulobacteraceae bacterium]